MYIYNEVDQKLVDQRVAQFRDQTARFLSGKLSEDEFRPLRLQNGLYVQLHAPMLRISVPYGLLSSKQVRMLAHIARKYDKGYGHFTTRQNIQFNWPTLESVPDILADLATVEMHAIQTSGNCIRNVTSDQLAGIAADEYEDPRPYCEIIRQWATLHPEFAYLPRKFKIAVCGAKQDRAATQLHDIGVYIVQNEQGEWGFKILAGGGLGRTPIIGKIVREYLPKQHLLSYLEAILRVYNLKGRRDNKYRARIKILVKETGLENFQRMVEAEWEHLKNGPLTLSDDRIEAMKSHFTAPNYDTAAANDTSLQQHLQSNSAFATWYKRNVVPHKVAGYKAVYVSLKSPRIPPGDITAEQMDAVAELADAYSFGEIRSTHSQNLLLSDVRQSDLFSLWEKLSALDLATANIDTLSDMICCPGLDFCSLANAESITIARQINDTFDDIDYQYDLGELKIKMSGCMNACGHHDVGHIGILGVDKKGEQFYQITLGGSAENDASLGARLGPSVAQTEVASTIKKILDVYIENRQEEERFLDTFRRLGIDPFKERVYASH